MADSRTPDPRTQTSAPAKGRARKTVRKTAAEAPAVIAAEKPVANGVAMAPIDRDAMVATAAYFRAVNRSFAPGYELEDWVSAEREIDALLNQPSQATQ